MKTGSKHGTIEKWIVLAFCSFSFVFSALYMAFAYEPNQNALGALASVYMDVISIAIVLVLVVNLYLEKTEFDTTTKLFLCLLVATMWALFLDFLTWANDGALSFYDGSYVYIVGSLCMGAILGAFFVLYFGSYLYEMYGLESVRIRAKICAVINLISFVITFTLAMTKTAFNIIDGHYECGSLYDLVTTIPVLTLLYMTCYALKHIKIIGFHDFIAALGYILIMITGALIEGESSMGFTYVSVSIADLFIFVMLQNKVIDKEKKNVEKWIKKSNTDDLSGFNNRHAYEEEIKTLEKGDIPENFVYVSIDINGLKVVNDTLGHNAGDELIVGAAECMKRVFSPYGKLFRTGGDEFAAFIYADSSELESIKRSVYEETEKWEGKYYSSLTLSCGYVTQKEMDNMTLHQVAVLADKRMYADKTRYYQKKGVDRRGQKNAHVSLCALYTKIIKANITDDKYQIINMDVDEQVKEKGYADKLSEWLHDFGVTAQVHPDDLTEYLEQTSLDNMRSYFKENNDSLRIIYRRKYNDEYRLTMMEIIPTAEYRDDAQTLYVYVKEIEKKTAGIDK